MEAALISLAEAYEAHHGYLLRVAWALTHHMPEAEDMESTLWCRVVVRWSQIDQRNIRGYLSQGLYHLNTDRLRQRAPVSIDTVPEWADDGHPYSDYMKSPISIDTIVESRERFAAVKAAVLALSAPERRAIAAAALGLDHQVNAQRVALHRARKRLRRLCA